MEKSRVRGEAKSMRQHQSWLLAVCTSAAIITTFQISSAVDVYTEPVGFITLTAGGTNNAPGANPYISQYALGMTQLPVARGPVSGSPVTNAIPVPATLTPGQFNRTADGFPTHFIEIVSGPNAGLFDDVVGNSSSTIYTAFDNSGLIASGQKFKVYPHWTFGKTFGPNNEAGFLGAQLPGSADNIQVWNPNTQGYATYYYKTTGIGGTGWRSTASGTINASNAVLYVDQGIAVVRRTSGDVTTKLVGAVKLGQTISPIVSNGVTFVGNIYAAGQPLATGGLYTGNASTGLLGAQLPGNADNVQIWNPNNQGYVTYYYKTTGIGGTGWRSTASGTIDAGTNTIPVGASAAIVRRAGNPSFNWYIPQPFSTNN